MLDQFLQDFGYFALFLGTFFEGETILVLAGFLAFRGYMDINMVVLVAFFGSYAGDQLWYFMGRRHGRKLLARKPRMLVTVALANKTARIIWALLVKEEDYRAPVAAAA